MKKGSSKSTVDPPTEVDTSKVPYERTETFDQNCFYCTIAVKHDMLRHTAITFLIKLLYMIEAVLGLMTFISLMIKM